MTISFRPPSGSLRLRRMDFDSVKAKFLDLTQQIQDDSVRDQFFTWMRDMMIPEFEKSSTDVNGVRDSEERLLTVSD